MAESPGSAASSSRVLAAVAVLAVLGGAYVAVMLVLFTGRGRVEEPAETARPPPRAEPVITVSAATCLDDPGEPGEPTPQPTEQAPEHEAEILWPAPTTSITSGFGSRADPLGSGSRQFHRGVDIAVPCGTSVVSAEEGEVVFADDTAGSGRTVKVAHAGGWLTRYAHLSRIEVAVGQKVKPGQHLGYSGASGRTTGPHLHFEIIRAPYAYDPLAFRYRHLPDRAFRPRLVGAPCRPETTAARRQAAEASGSADFPATLEVERYLEK